jgi:hypothetical protein
METRLIVAIGKAFRNASIKGFRASCFKTGCPCGVFANACSREAEANTIRAEGEGMFHRSSLIE